MISRRKFIQSISALSILPIVTRAQDSEEEIIEDVEVINFKKDAIRVLQSVTLETSTLITVLAHKDSKLEFVIRSTNNSLVPIYNVETIDMKLGDFVIYQIFVDQMETQASYRLEILDETHSQKINKNFKSLDTSRRDIKIAFLTCSSHRNAEPQKTMFSQLQSNKPDLIFFPGDLIYANSAMDTALGRPATPKDAYTVYCKTFMELDFYSSENLIPVFSTWDDHDMAFNNADSTHPNREIMFKMFRNFYPVDSRVAGITNGPGVSFCFEAFGAQFLFLDVRYFFDKKKKFLLGADQFNWLINNCQESDKPKFIISALQWWNYGKMAECFEKEATPELNELLRVLKSLPQAVLFLSGDVHYSQVQTVGKEVLGYPTYEITSSAVFSMSSRGFGKRSKEKGQLHYYGYPNFLMFEDTYFLKNKIEMTVRCVSETSHREFNFELKVQN